MTVIVTKRLMLKPTKKYPFVDDEHIKKMVQWLNDPDVVKYSEQRHRKHNGATQQQYILYGPREFREIHTSDTFIGTIAAHVDKNNSVADVGILIGEKTEWGKGYGTEAWQAFCDVLLTGEGVRKIEAGAMACNFGMIKIFRKTHMHLEGQRNAHFKLGNDLIDLIQYAKYSFNRPLYE